MNVKAVLSCVLFAFLFSCFSVCPAQVKFEEVVRVATPDGKLGSGFVVATRGGKAEVWTNAHVAGRAGSSCTIEWGPTKEKTVGRVVSSRLDRNRGIDAAKIIVTVPRSSIVSPIPVGRCNWDFNSADVGGWFMGHYLHSVRIKPDSHRVAIGVSYSPKPTPGESGSVIKDEEGKAIGVVTWCFGKNDQWGVFQPIENWTGEKIRRPVGAVTVLKVREVGCANAD